MANIQVEIQRIIFDTSDPDMTEITIEIKHDDPGNILMKSRYSRRFPARIPAVSFLTPGSPDFIFGNSMNSYLLW